MMLWFSMTAWTIVFGVTAPGAIRVLIGKGADHDAVKFSFHLFAIIIIAFNLRWVFAPDNMAVLEVLRAFSGVLALYLCAIVRFYRSAS